MTEAEIQNYKNKLDELGIFYNKEDARAVGFTEAEIINWIAECVSLFSEIGVNNTVINSFLDFFKPRNESVTDSSARSIYGRETVIEIMTIGRFKQKIDDTSYFPSATKNFFVESGHYYARIAFSAARAVLQKKHDDEKLVPRALESCVSKSTEFAHLASHLSGVERNYLDGDAQGLMTACTSLMDSLLNLDLDLKEKGELANKLRSLAEDKVKLQKFGVSKDSVLAINCSRVIRNERVIHTKKMPLRYDLPFLCALGYAYLVLHFLESFLACHDVTGFTENDEI